MSNNANVELSDAEIEAANQARIDAANAAKTSQEQKTKSTSSPSVEKSSESQQSGNTKESEAEKQATPTSNAQEPTSPSSSEADTFSTSSTGCGNSVLLDKRLKIFRSKEKTIWFFFVHPLLGSTSNRYTISNTYGVLQGDTDQVSDEDSVLFMARTDSESFDKLPVDIAGALTTSLYFAVYLDEGRYKPIIGVKYFDLWYDPDTDSVELIFWANVLVDSLSGDLSTVYPDSIRNGILTNGTFDSRSQACIFHCRGQKWDVTTSRKGGGAQTATGLFIFTKPALILNPGKIYEGSQADAIVDQMPTVLNFLAAST